MSQARIDDYVNAAGTGAPSFSQGLSPVAEVLVKAGNGHGSSSTQIRRFSTIEVNNGGTGITYVDSATLGGTFTIDEAGLYSITYIDQNGSTNELGLTVNSSELTTAPQSLTNEADLLGIVAIPNAGNTMIISVVRRFAAGDVVRPHGNVGGTPSTSVIKSRFHIIQLAKEE